MRRAETGMLFDGMGVQHNITWLGLGLVFKQVTLVWLWFVCDGVSCCGAKGVPVQCSL